MALSSRAAHLVLVQSAHLWCSGCSSHVHRRSFKTAFSQHKLEKRSLNTRSADSCCVACGAAHARRGEHSSLLHRTWNATSSWACKAVSTGSQASSDATSILSGADLEEKDDSDPDEDDLNADLDASNMSATQADEAITGYLQEEPAGATYVVKSRAEAYQQVGLHNLCSICPASRIEELLLTRTNNIKGIYCEMISSYKAMPLTIDTGLTPLLYSLTCGIDALSWQHSEECLREVISLHLTKHPCS